MLIYLLLADRDVEIVADRGIDATVGAAGWEDHLQGDGDRIPGGKFRGAACIRGIEAVSRQLATHFPAQAPAAQ